MNIVILNRFPLSKIKYYEWVDIHTNLYVFSKEQNYTQKNLYTYLRFYDNYDESEKVILDIMELAKEINIDYIVALSEKDILRAGSLRDFLQLSGLNTELSYNFRDKVIMKEKLKENDIKTASFSPVSSVPSIRTFMDHHKNHSQFVIKPRRDAGSKGVKIFGKLDELKDFFNNQSTFTPNITNEWMIETFVDGDLYHIDGIYSGNNIISMFISKYITSCLNFNENQPLLSGMISKNNIYYKGISEIIENSLKALGKEATFIYHAEIFVTKAGEFVVNEIACRIGGGKIYPTIKNVCNYDILSEYFRIITGQQYSENFTAESQGGWVLIPPRSGELKAIPNNLEYEWIVEQEFTGKQGEIYKNAQSSGDRIYDAVVVGNDFKDISMKLEKIVSEVCENISYGKECVNEKRI